MAWTGHPRVTAVRRRYAIADVVVETLDGFRRHQSGRNAAVLAYWGFLSVFPLLLAATTVYAQQYGSADEAKAMLESTVAQMKADKEQTIKQINDGAIKDKDLYPYCGGPDGMFTAHPNPKVRAISMKNLKDEEGKAFLEDVYDKVEEDEFTEVEYIWKRPGEDKPVQKVAYLTKVDDQVCGVGYYKE